jgi:CelD/BcsL family acetyltransferase involved in cellulose biosynthesis
MDAAAAQADGAHAFLRAAWFQAPSPRPLQTLVARRRNGQVLAALPLLPRRLPLDVARVAGNYWPFRSFPIAADACDGEVAALLRHPDLRRALGPVWRVGPIFADDPTFHHLHRLAPAAGWSVLQRRLGTCFEIDVRALRESGPWPRASTMKKHRWREKGLRQEGVLTYRRVTGAEWQEADLDAVAAIESRCWLAEQEGGADTQFSRPEQRRFWTEVAQDPVLAPMLFCSILRVGAVPAAFAFGMEVGRVRYYIANNYEPRFARHSPGRILLTSDFAEAAESGIERISWGSGDAGYKSAMGAVPGPAIWDVLLVRPPLLAPPLRRLWTGSFSQVAS